MICLIILTLVSNTLTEGISLEREMDVNMNGKCVRRILDIFAQVSDLILVDICSLTALDIGIVYPNHAILLYNTCRGRRIQITQRPHFYVLYIETMDQFKSTVDLLVASSSWNPRAKIIIHISRNMSNDLPAILSILKHHFVNRFILLHTQVNNPAFVDILSWNVQDVSAVYANTDANLQAVSTCHNGTLVNETINLFPYTYYSNFSFHTVKIATIRIPPYLINLNNTRLPGLEVSLMRLLQERLRFPIEYIQNPFKNWGLKINGNYTDTFSLLINRSADIMLAMWHPNISDNLDFDCTFCYMEDAVVWFVPTARYVALWKTFFFTFSTQVWIASFVTLGVVAFVWVYYDRKLRNIPFSTAIIELWAIHLGISIAAPGPNRLLFMIWVFYSFLLLCAYQSKLISVLTKPIYEHQISTLQDIFDANIQFGFHYGLQRMFENETTATYQRVYTNVVSCPLSEECLNRTAFMRDFANAKGRRQTNYLMPKYYVGADGKLLLYGFKGALWWYPIQMVMVKGLPIFDTANDMLYRIKQSGFISKWYKDVDYLTKLLMSRSRKENAVVSVISLDHLQGPFFLLSLGLTTSIIVFSFELLTFSNRKKI